MSDIKRYDPEANCTGDAFMSEESTGEYVEYSEYELLLESHTHLHSEITNLRSVVRRLERELRDSEKQCGYDPDIYDRSI